MNARRPLAFGLVVAVAASPALASNGTHDGLKSGYPTVHALRSGAFVPAVDLKSSYPQLHALATAPPAGAVSMQARGFHWGDAGIGAGVGALAIGMLAIIGALLTRRSRAGRLTA
jgi:hypothetical protein